MRCIRVYSYYYPQNLAPAHISQFISVSSVFSCSKIRVVRVIRVKKLWLRLAALGNQWLYLPLRALLSKFSRISAPLALISGSSPSSFSSFPSVKFSFGFHFLQRGFCDMHKSFLKLRKFFVRLQKRFVTRISGLFFLL